MINRLLMGPHALTLAFLAILCVLSVGLLLEWAILDDPDDLPRFVAVGSGENIEQAAALAGFSFPELSEFSEMIDRPMFSEGRQYQSPALQSTAEEEAVKTPLSFKLMGLVFSPEGKIALLKTQSGKYKRLQLGGRLDGWTLQDFADDRVVMEQGGDRRDLLLLKRKKKRPGLQADESGESTDGMTDGSEESGMEGSMEGEVDPSAGELAEPVTEGEEAVPSESLE